MLLISDLGRRGPLGDKGQFEVVDDAVDHAVSGEKGDNLHPGTALRADHGINFIDLADHLGPAFGGDGAGLVVYDPESLAADLLGFPPMGVGIETVITDSDLALVGNMGSHSGDELRVVHALRLSGVFAIPIADLTLFLREREPLQTEKRADHVFPHPLGLMPSLGPDPAVDIEPRVPPGQKRDESLHFFTDFECDRVRENVDFTST
jgi:hypothetical protein